MVRTPSAKPFYFLAKSQAPGVGELSVHVSLAARFGLENRAEAIIDVIEDASAATAAHVELSFRDTHLSRADMWRILHRLERTVVYKGQQIHYLGRAVCEIRAVYISGSEVESALVVQAKTRPIFRSGSARYTILVQISLEMLQYWRDGDLMHERLISGYLTELFRRWNEQKVRHHVTIVLFGREVLPVVDVVGEQGAESRDFFHLIATDAMSSQWSDVRRQLKRAFNGTSLPRLVSLAASGNMLQALHVSAMDFANDNIDPQLSSTGSSIIAVTAGAGLFETTHTALKNITHLLMGNSIGVDIVSLSPKPLHPVPLFSYSRAGAVEYALPHWVDISFWDGTGFENSPCWIMPVVYPDVTHVALPLIQLHNNSIDKPSARQMARYDDEVFGSTTVTAADNQVREAPFESEPRSIDISQDRAPAYTANMAPRPQFTSAFSDVVDPGASITARSPSVDGAVYRAKRDSLPPHPLMSTSRKISLGPKGLALSRGTASTTVSAEHAQHNRGMTELVPLPSGDTSSGIAKQIRQSLARQPSQQSLVSYPRVLTAEISKPINIQHADRNGIERGAEPGRLLERMMLSSVSEASLTNAASLSETPRAKTDPFYAAMKAAEQEGEWADSPWVTLLEPSNPKPESMRVAAQYRKWQHIFPRAVSSSVFKWTSMCTPASLPLTTDYHPTARVLGKFFTKRIRQLVIPTMPYSCQADSVYVFKQLVLLRLTHGFQISAVELSAAQETEAIGNNPITMSLGNVHHILQRLSDGQIQVIEYTLKSTESAGGLLAGNAAEICDTAIWSATLPKSISAKVQLNVTRPDHTWSMLDDQFTSQDLLSRSLTLSRMRFVLIPVEPPRPGLATPSPARGLSDEERHIDGIQRLTQLWQRNRYLSQEDKRHQASMFTAKSTPQVTARDPNPLAIEYQTRDPSAVINAYGPLLSGQSTGTEHLTPLFQESEMYHSSTFDIVKLVKQMQEPPPHGVEVRDRRWFARMHFKCFRGDEMVNWLLKVFKDLQSREDAIALGNELMNRGLFSHVRARHEFRDGNYFYQIASTYRTTLYPDNASMFSKTARSVPSTPMLESRPSPMLRALHDDDSSSGKPTPVFAPRDKTEILLSDSMTLNVDPGGMSDQPEVITLHYDRIHNPENCYHIQVEWVNTTVMLVRDAVNRWTALAENHGLKLVQLPLVEASKLCLQHVFDQPVPVKLAVRPPDNVSVTPSLDAHTFASRFAEDPLAYQKALLRKFDFVLDLEAATSFSIKLDVRYSYGKPDYELTQFVHKSGSLLVQVIEDEEKDFIIVPNRLLSQRSAPVTRASESEPIFEVVRRFVALCRDEPALKAFYDEANRMRVVPQSPFAPTALGLDSEIPPIQLPPRLAHRTILKTIQ
ncbi:hypothetical protein BAUCODRAFT_27950 [Baudoinia panamericana UAMH 10762]|uniref:Vacuolar membrane-associated protein IML1 n=1 Tax=Baudoinia panamericana (strain UAMH 10762) TaxID=717646 RepID=M2MYF2_BAUPA|nr:uncharacterized protein BAUCODRAFT_27950 [Baudoinia panamericana UAMH 10762]EMC91679.1 hypothetical protein BAUCODRAFT_27950 [Baudoinia panamericana UAMH 10762]